MASPSTPSTVNFIQAQAFILAGSGSAIGDTTITLQSMVGLDGQNIVTADLGSFAYGTLEPGNGTQEEAILFTGVTQNSNGTATLTGVSSLGFKTPYTVTTGLTKSHAGSVKFVLSNDAAFYNNLILYLNSIAGAGAANASTTVKGIVQAATVAQTEAGTATGSTGAVLGVTPDALALTTNSQYVVSARQTGIPYAAAGGTSSAYTATTATGTLQTLSSGTFINFLVPVTNASGATINVNGIGAKTLKKSATVSLASADLLAGQVASAVYDGTNFQVLSPSPRYFSSGTASKNLADANTTQTIAHGLAVTPKKIRFSYFYSDGTNSSSGAGVFDLSGQRSSAFGARASSATAGVVTSTTAGIILASRVIVSDYQTGTVSVDATNISIAWVLTGAPSSTYTFIWEAEA